MTAKAQPKTDMLFMVLDQWEPNKTGRESKISFQNDLNLPQRKVSFPAILVYSIITCFESAFTAN